MLMLMLWVRISVGVEKGPRGGLHDDEVQIAKIIDFRGRPGPPGRRIFAPPDAVDTHFRPANENVTSIKRNA